MALNLLSIDLENWYHTTGLALPRDRWQYCEDRVKDSTDRLLDILDTYNVTAVFFVLGCVAERHPDLIREIVRRGHEVGSHGSSHRMISEMTAEQFRADLRSSLRTIEAIVGRPVRYFRAPSWSISSDRYEVLEILEEEGILCDSSLQPFRTPLSGVHGIPLEPFRPVMNGRRLNLVEIPPAVMGVGPMRVPFAGGLYLRFWPSWFSIFALNRVNRSRAGMLYVHPWEIDVGIPRLKVPPLIRFAQYYNLRTTEPKLRSLLDRFSFTSLSNFLAEGVFPEYQLQPSPVLQAAAGKAGR